MNNQLKRQNEAVMRLTDEAEQSQKREGGLQVELRESKRRYTDLEGNLKEDLMMARIRDTENAQCVAELTQKISNLEFKNQELSTEDDLTTSINESGRMRELQDKVACLRAQVTRLALMNSKLTQSLSMHNLAASFHSDTSGSTPRQSPSSSPSNSQLCLDLGSTMDLSNTPSNLSNLSNLSTNALSNMSTLDLPSSSSDPLPPSSSHNLQRLNSNP